MAAYVLQRQPRVGEKKLQKLLYYSQAWALVWTGRQLFPEHFEAWAEGPVTPKVYGEFHHDRQLSGAPAHVSTTARRIIDVVLKVYGHRSGEWLSRLSHRERPWREARGPLPEGAMSRARITSASMRNYYATFSAAPYRFERGFLRGLEAIVTMPIDEVDLLDAAPVEGGSFVRWLAQGDS